jgi:membrane-bound ClpP family serine protease
MIVVEDRDMTALGLVLLLMGATLVVVEAHVPGGVAGAAGGVALMVGGVIVIAALGGSVALAVPMAVGIGAVVGGWTLLAARKTVAARRGRVQAGAEALEGRVGVVRRWSEPAGQVFVDGALWRAQRDWIGPDGGALDEGDPVVVERVSGLTLSVRPAEEWELG